MIGNILGILETYFDLILNLAKTTWTAVSFLLASVPLIGGLTAFLPSIIGTAFIFTIAVFVVRFLLSR